MITLKQLLDYGTDTLQKTGKIDARSDAWYLLSYCMGISKTEYYMKENMPAGADDEKRYRKNIELRVLGKPLQYITGSQEFMGLDFVVNESVLIPRQDTETLVECALEFIKKDVKKKHLRILDMCTGSGCIAISIAKLADNDNIRVEASDISEEAILTAAYNAGKNCVKVYFTKSDIWKNISGKYDFIVSNPPYIKSSIIPTLMKEVRDFEPVVALDGGKDGLIFYRKIIKGAANHLNNNGMLFFEIGYDQAEQVSDLMKRNGFGNINVLKDLAGLDRVVYGTLMMED